MSTISNETILASLRSNGLDIVSLASLLDVITNTHPNHHLLNAHFVPSMLRLNSELKRRAGSTVMVHKLGIMSVREPAVFVYWYINLFDRHFIAGSDGDTVMDIYLTVTTPELFDAEYPVFKRKAG